ncbi:unnamed protein product [Fusarium graminearum]|nr:unnamed protein product [Fusarium graminearum]CAG1988088.1 unnamed protein product [Fusarium graminearum]
MHFSSVVVQTLLAIGVTVARNEKFRRGVKPNGPIDPGITSKCTYYDEWMDNGYTNCQKWLMDWAITEQKFSEYNPTVDDDCSGIKVGHSYCVEINHCLPEEPDKPEVTSTDISGSETTDTKEPHILTQEGLIESCVDLHKASEADTCDQIVSSFGTFDFDTFFHMESSYCSGLWVGYYYCVGVPGTTTSAPTKTTATATEPTGSKNPTVLQKGLIKGYALFHQAGKGDTCAKIVSNLELLNMNAFYK